MKKIIINGQHFILHPSGAIYWEEKKSLLLADAHLGKVAHFRKNGIAVPRKAERAFYQKITQLLSLFSVKRILFLGDLFHSFQNNEWHYLIILFPYVTNNNNNKKRKKNDRFFH